MVLTIMDSYIRIPVLNCMIMILKNGAITVREQTAAYIQAGIKMIMIIGIITGRAARQLPVFKR